MIVKAIRAPRGERPRVPAIIPFVYTPLSDLRCRHCLTKVVGDPVIARLCPSVTRIEMPEKPLWVPGCEKH